MVEEELVEIQASEPGRKRRGTRPDRQSPVCCHGKGVWPNNMQRTCRKERARSMRKSRRARFPSLIADGSSRQRKAAGMAATAIATISLMRTNTPSGR